LLKENKLKILITGANGLLGSNLCKSYQDNYTIIATDITLPKFSFSINTILDITNDNDLDVIIREKPEIIIHCAAIVNVDLCEKNPSLAQRINEKGSEKIAKISKEAGSYLVHISTDAVFDGKKGDYSEKDIPNPINLYGRTKLKAEELIQKNSEQYSIVRTNIYGWNHENKFSLAEWMLNKLENNEPLPAFRDIFFTPILVTDLAPCLLELKEKDFNGIIHIAGSEKCSKLEFAYNLAEVFNLDKNLIKPISYKDLKFVANRPEDISLDCSIAKSLLDTKLPNIKSGLRQMRQLRFEGYVKDLKKGF
jgi:dTDP-4-dehydrorhamnose reductase